MAKETALRRFGHNLRVRREALGYSQEQLAGKADVDRTYVGGVEWATLKPPLRVAKAFGTTVSGLCERIDS